ncbi:UNVERIFIED_CONTAM: hypothetical protein HDU68_005027 [Siphonaria sp. JEL0065]|nr:hypothetical protein HDU68_005027 [Siphonaria sp. JEL0065]
MDGSNACTNTKDAMRMFQLPTDRFRDIKLSSEYLSIFDFVDSLPFDIMPSLPSLQSYELSAAASNTNMNSFFMPPAIQSSWLIQDVLTGRYGLASDPQILLQPLPTTVPPFLMQNPMTFDSLLPMTPTATLSPPQDCFFSSQISPTNPNHHHRSLLESPTVLSNSGLNVQAFPAAALTVDLRSSTTSGQAGLQVVADTQDNESDTELDNADIYCPSKTSASKITIKRSHKRKSNSPASSTTDSQDPKNKSRFRFSSAQQSEMIKRYDAEPFPSYESMTKTAQEFGTTFYKIKIWYQNRRSAEKRRAYGGK